MTVVQSAARSADEKDALTDAPWVDQTDALMAEYSAARSAVCLVASTVVHSAVWLDACHKER